MKEPMSETPMQRAIREANEQVEQAALEAAEAEKAPAPIPPPRREALLVLKLEYDTRGTCVRITGALGAQQVLQWSGTGQADLSVGRAAEETLRLGALGALLGR